MTGLKPYCQHVYEREEGMTPEHIDLYRQLSETKIYKKRFGKFERGDKYVDGLSGNVRLATFTDKLFYEHAKDNDIILPPVFDPENESRCLWGMVDWDKLSDKFISTDGQYLVMRRRGEELHNIVDRLDIALIKAILKQEEGRDDTGTDK